MAQQKLPTAIQQQLDRAEEIERQLAEQNQPPSDTPPVKTPQHVNKEEPTPEPEPTNPTLGTNSPEPDVTPEPAPAPVAEETWEQKFKTLEGKYANEVPMLAAKAREEAEKRKAVEDRIRKLEEDKQKAPPEPPRQALVTKEDEDAFGKDMVDFTARAIQDGLYGPISDLNKKVAALQNVVANLQHLPKQVNSMQDHVEQTEESIFWDAVSKEIPDWQTIDADPRWVAFLDTSPEFSTMTYRELATDAVVKRNPRAIFSLVAKWKDHEGITAAAEQATKNQKKLESQITPSKATAKAPEPTQPEVWTMQRYNDAFDFRKTQGMSAKDIQALQLAADLALAEGRIQ